MYIYIYIYLRDTEKFYFQFRIEMRLMTSKYKPTNEYRTWSAAVSITRL